MDIVSLSPGLFAFNTGQKTSTVSPEHWKICKLMNNTRFGDSECKIKYKLQRLWPSSVVNDVLKIEIVVVPSSGSNLLL